MNATTGVIQIKAGSVLCATLLGCVVGVPILVSGASDLTFAATGQVGLGGLVFDERVGASLDLTMSMVGMKGLIHGPAKAASGMRFVDDLTVGAGNVYNSARGVENVKRARSADRGGDE